MKVYGESTYKGFLILKDNNNPPNRSKHFISSVDKTFMSDDKVNISVRNGRYGDYVIEDYKIGTNPQVDLAIKTWYNERRKQRKHVGELPKNFFSKLFPRKKSR